MLSRRWAAPVISAKNHARVQLFSQSIVYQAGSDVMSIDGPPYHAVSESHAFSDDDTKAAVRLTLLYLCDGVFFLPDPFRAEGGPSTGLEDADRYPGLDLLILGYQLQSETAVHGIPMGEQSRYQ